MEPEEFSMSSVPLLSGLFSCACDLGKGLRESVNRILVPSNGNEPQKEMARFAQRTLHPCPNRMSRTSVRL